MVNQDGINKLVKLLPFASGLLVFLGVLKISVFYGYFGISIMSYLSLSDFLVLFFDDINLLIIIVLIGLVHVTTSDEITEKMETDLVDKVFLRFKSLYAILFGVSLSTLLILTFSEEIAINIWTIYLMVFLGIQFITTVFLKRVKNKETGEIEAEISRENIVKIVLAIILISIIPLISYRDIREVKNNNVRIALYLKNGEKVTNSSRKYYLGKAGEYHFFQSIVNTKTTIINDSEVSKIIFKH